MRKWFAFIGILVITFCLFIAYDNAHAAGKVIGAIMSTDNSYYRSIHESFLKSLEAKGIKTEMHVQKPAPDTMAWINAARKFVALDVDILVTYGAPATRAVLSENFKKPIVFAGVPDIQGFNIKAGTVTGVTSKVSIAGMLKTLKQISNFATLGIIYNSTEQSTAQETTTIESLQDKFSFKAVRINIKGGKDTANIKGVDAVIITSSCAVMTCLDDLVKAARKQKIPTAMLMGGGEESGILLTLAADPVEQGQKAADILSRIIRGENPSSIPIESPTKISLIINLKEANALGLNVPFDILSAATRVIK